MFGAIGDDLRLYRRLIGMQIRSQTQYRVSLIVDIFTSFAVTVLEFGALLLLFSTFPTLGGWRVGEIVLLSALASISFGLAEMVGAGIDNFSETVRLGDFDRALLRPMGALTQIIGSDFRLRRLGRIAQGVIAFVVALRLLPQLHWTLDKVILLPLSLVSGMLIFLAVLLLGATLCFWTVETTELTNIFTYGGREMLNYPLTIYQRAFQGFFLFVVPLAFGSYAPACYLLGRPLPFGLPGLVVFAAGPIAVVFGGVALCIWRVGARHYQSTGS